MTIKNVWLEELKGIFTAATFSAIQAKCKGVNRISASHMVSLESINPLKDLAYFESTQAH